MPRKSNSGTPGAKQRRIRKRLEAYRARRSTRIRRRIPRAAVPSFFTLMNLFSGFLSLTQTLEGNFENAAWLIVLAGFFDLLDGMMARLTNGSSLFGVELDSLSDIVSFGVAPAFLAYVFGLAHLGTVGLVVASLPAVCGAVRLARFNVSFSGEKRDYFIGLPIPTQAIGIVALVLNRDAISRWTALEASDVTVLAPAIILLSVLMISNIRFDAAPRPSPDYFRSHPLKASLYAAGLILVLVFQRFGLIVVLTVYLAVGIGRAIVGAARALAEDPDKAASDPAAGP